MSRRPLVLLHGYGDQAESFATWRNKLQPGAKTVDIHIANYVSRTNEITLADLGEGLDRALRDHEHLRRGDEFDAVVHSTGMLVLREWMNRRRPERAKRVKHIIGLAPATFGSPLAAKGRSILGAIFKGQPQLGPDFMEAGDKILMSLELGSPYTWLLAEKDLVGDDECCYGEDDDTPWPFIFVGTDGYRGLRRLVNKPGTDGTVRWAGVGFNSRRINLDMTQEGPVGGADAPRLDLGKWRNVDVPLVLVRGRNHGSLLRNPSREVVGMVQRALEVQDKAGYDAWRSQYAISNDQLVDPRGPTRGQLWQQFVLRVVDERGDPVPDYYVELCDVVNDKCRPLDDFDIDVHTSTDDTSYRCFHVNLTKLVDRRPSRLVVRIAAISGTELIAYHGCNSQTFSANVDLPEPPAIHADEKWDAILDLGCFDSLYGPPQPGPLTGRDARLFTPLTTTLIELTLNREPMPPSGANRVLFFAKV